MSLETILKALYRGSGGQEERQLQVDKRNSLLIAHGLPPYTEITRRGGGWQTMATTAVAALVIRPSTTAMATLWNGEPAGGKSYIIDRAFAHQLVSTAAAGFHSLWLCVHPAGMAAVTDDITARNSLSGKKGYVGFSRFDNGATVVADGWFPWGNWGEVEPTGVLPGGHVEAVVEGRIIIPPTAALSLQVVASVVGNTFTAGFAWYEEQLDLE